MSAIAFPGNKEHLRVDEVPGDDLVLAEAYRFLNAVYAAAEGAAPPALGPVLSESALPHVPSWRGDQAPGAMVAKAASDQLAERLVRFRRQVARLKLDAETANEVQFSLTISADLILMETEWPGQKSWQDNPLEFRLFDTTGGKARVIERAEELAGTRRLDDLRLSRVYALILSASPMGVTDLPEKLLTHFQPKTTAPVLRRNGPPHADRQGRDHIADLLAQRQIWFAPLIALAMFVLVSFVGWLGLKWWSLELVARMAG